MKGCLIFTVNQILRILLLNLVLWPLALTAAEAAPPRQGPPAGPPLILYYGEAEGQYTLTVSVAEGGSGLAQVVLPDLTSPGAIFTSPGNHSHTYTFDAADDLSGDFTVTASDNAGNVTNQTLTLINDDRPPTPQLRLPLNPPLLFDLTWAGVDWADETDVPGSGLRHYDVQVRAGLNGDWSDLLVNTTAQQYRFAGQPAVDYYFQIRATDNVNNISDWFLAGPLRVEPVTKYYFHGNERVAMRRGDQVYYLQGDHLGSTALVTDAAGNVVSEVRYQPYGQERWSTGVSPTDFGFTSQRAEAGFGLMDYNARYYSPALGRFISPDTLVPEPANPQSLNRYSYVYSNPLKYTDPSGHCTEFGDDACWSEYERIKFVDQISDSDTILTGDGTVPLHEANFYRLRQYREDRLNPVDYPSLSLPPGTYTIEATASGTLPGVEGQISAGLVHFNSKGDVVVGTISIGGGGTTNIIGLNEGLEFGYTEEDNLSTSIPGKEVYITGGAEAVVGSLTASGTLSEDQVRGGSLNVDLGGKVPFFMPASLSGGTNHTFDRAVFQYSTTNGVRYFGPISNFHSD
jgi:RHS repeat-associated protein